MASLPPPRLTTPMLSILFGQFCPNPLWLCDYTSKTVTFILH